jgi:hypothetical protein
VLSQRSLSEPVIAEGAIATQGRMGSHPAEPCKRRRGMRNRRATAILLVILFVAVGFGLFGSGRTKAEPQAEEAKKKLDQLQKKMPDLFKVWLAKALEIWGGQLKSELKLLRWIGSTEVKVTYSCSFPEEVPISDFVLTLHLRYYDGRWTTTDMRTSNPKIAGADLMLLIDQASPE